MNNPDLLNIVRGQEEEIKRLRALQQEQPGVNFQDKYKKALKEISGIIQANKQLKEELDKLRHSRSTEVENFTSIQKEEFHKAYDKLLREKNELAIMNQNLQLEKQNLNYEVESMQSHVALLKNQQMNISQQNEAIRIKKDNEGSSSSKHHHDLLKEKQSEFQKKLQNYEQHHTKLNRVNRKLEEKITELENKLLSNDKNWKNHLEEKEVQIRQSNHKVRQNYLEECGKLRKEINHLKSNNTELQIKIQSIQNSKNPIKAENQQQDKYLIRTLNELKAEMGPIRTEIIELNQMNSHDREQILRDKANLEIKVVELQGDVEKYSATIKNLEQKVIKNHQKMIYSEDQGRLLKKLEEENRILGGRVIVLESKDIALKNRTGEDLEERVLEFQTRIEMLLSEKENIANIKNISIHQMIALKAYILELDGKIRTLAHENQYSVGKYKSYKEKYLIAIRDSKQYEFIINSHKTKIQGYDKLVIKLQTELQRMMKINQHQIETVSNESTHFEVYKKKFLAIQDKLVLQEKYSLQQLQTVKLNYETKIVDLAIKAEEMKNLRETVELYRVKNQELVRTLTNKQNQLLEARLSIGPKIINTEIEVNNVSKQTKQLINNLYETIHNNDDRIFKLQNQIRSQQDKYTSRIRTIERQNEDLRNDYNGIKNNSSNENALIELENEVKKYKMKYNEIQSQGINVEHPSNQTDQFKKINELQSKLSILEVDYEEQVIKLSSEINMKKRLETQLQTQINNNETQFQDFTEKSMTMSRKLQELKNQLHDYEEEIRRLNQLNNNEKMSSSFIEQNKMNLLSAELDHLKSDYLKLNQKYGKVEIKLREAENQLQSLKLRNISNVEVSQIDAIRRQLQMKDEENNDLRKQIGLLRNKLMNLENDKSESYYTMLIQQKDGNLKRLNQELMEAKEVIDTVYGKDMQINTLKNQNKKIKSEIDELNELIMKFSNDIRKIKVNEFEYTQRIEELQIMSHDKDFTINKIKSQLSHLQDENQRLRNELGFIKESYQKIQYSLLEKNDEISQLQLNLSNLKNRQNDNKNWQIDEQMNIRQETINKLTLELNYLKKSNTEIKNQNEQNDEQLAKLRIENMNYQNENSKLRNELNESNQNYTLKEQQLNKLNMELNSFKQNQDKNYENQHLISKLRMQINALKNKLSVSEEQTFEKDSNLLRIRNQMFCIKESLKTIQEELEIKSQSLAKQNNEIANLKMLQNNNENEFVDREKTISRLTFELQNSQRNYHNIEMEMEIKEKQLNNINQELFRLKGNMSIHQDQIDNHNSTVTRLSNEIGILKREIQRLNQEILLKNQQISRLNDEIFRMKLEGSSVTNQNTMQWDSENYMLKSKIKNLEDQLTENQHIIGRLKLQKSNYTMENTLEAENYTLKQKIRYLEKELEDKQRQLNKMKTNQNNSSLWDLQITNLKNKIENQYQQIIQKENQISRLQIQNLKTEQNKFLSDRLKHLEQEIESKNMIIKRMQSGLLLTAGESYSFTSDNQLMEQLQRKNYESDEKDQQLLNLQIKIDLLEKLNQQMKLSNNENINKYEIQQRTRIQRQNKFKQQVFLLEQQLNTRRTKIMEPLEHPNLSHIDLNNLNDMKFGLNLYQNEVDRLGRVVCQLQEQVTSLRMKLTEFMNQQDRLQQNTLTMVLMFSQIQSLRIQIGLKQAQIADIRKNLLALASGDINHEEINLCLRKYEEDYRSQQSHATQTIVKFKQGEWRQSDVNIIDQAYLQNVINRSQQRYQFQELKDTISQQQQQSNVHIQQQIQPHLQIQPHRQVNPNMQIQSSMQVQSNFQVQPHVQVQPNIANVQRNVLISSEQSNLQRNIQSSGQLGIVRSTYNQPNSHVLNEQQKLMHQSPSVQPRHNIHIGSVNSKVVRPEIIHSHHRIGNQPQIGNNPAQPINQFRQ